MVRVSLGISIHIGVLLGRGIVRLRKVLASQSHPPFGKPLLLRGQLLTERQEEARILQQTHPVFSPRGRAVRYIFLTATLNLKCCA
jgi:hypothetical protein